MALELVLRPPDVIAMWSWTEPPTGFDQRPLRLTTSIVICLLCYLPQGLAIYAFPSFLEIKFLALEYGQISIVVEGGKNLRV